MDDPKGFIKIYRKLLEWEWYSDANTTKLFLHCLLKANWEEKRWHGFIIQPGQFVTSLKQLAVESGLSVKQVRTALEHLESTGELVGNSASKTAGKGQEEGQDKKLPRGRIITIQNWDAYQGEGKESGNERANKWAGKRQAKGKQRATTKEYKELKEVKNKPPKPPLLDQRKQEPLEPGDEYDTEGWEIP